MNPFLMASLGISAAQAGMGIFQMFRAKKPDRPNYKIPESMKRSLKLSQRAASSPTMPGESIMQQQIGTSMATGIETAKRSGNAANVMDVIQGMDKSQKGSILQMALQRAQYRDTNQQRYQQDLQRYSEYEDKAWEWNKAKPYIDAQRQYQTDKQAGFQNAMTGIQSGLSTGAAAYSQNQMTQRYENLYGNRYNQSGAPSLMGTFHEGGSDYWSQVGGVTQDQNQYF